jgi:hypothetical protein
VGIDRCQYRCSALRTFADYATGILTKSRLRKPDGRKSKTVADDAIAQSDGPVLPPNGG